MQLIKKLSKMIDEELNDAEKYARCALNYKEENVGIAEMFYSLSLEEMKHMQQLHNHVVKLIDEVQASGKTVPVGMMEMYDYIHEQQIEHSAEVRVLQSMFRE